jgi:hypothetical protein
MSPPFYDKKVPLSRVDNKGQGGASVDNMLIMWISLLFFTCFLPIFVISSASCYNVSQENPMFHVKHFLYQQSFVDSRK